MEIISADQRLVATASVPVELRSTIDSKVQVESLNCSLNDGEETPCPEPLVFAGLVDGNYVLRVTLTDSRGLTAKAATSWTVDVTKPAIAVSAKPVDFSGPNVTFEFNASDALSGVARIECALDTENYTTCTTPFKRDGLTAGPHSFKVRSIDKAGNIGEANQTDWNVNLDAPVLTLRGPNPFEGSHNARVEFSATAVGATITRFECAIDGGTPAPCTSPKDYTALAEGRHTVSVRAFNDVNNTSSALAVMWTVDVTPPTLPTITTATTPFTNLRSASFMFSANDTASGVAS